MRHRPLWRVHRHATAKQPRQHKMNDDAKATYLHTKCMLITTETPAPRGQRANCGRIKSDTSMMMYFPQESRHGCLSRQNAWLAHSPTVGTETTVLGSSSFGGIDVEKSVSRYPEEFWDATRSDSDINTSQ